VGFRFTGTGFFLERVLGTVLHDDRGASSHLLVSRVVIRNPSSFGSLVHSFGTLFESFAAYSDGVSPRRCRRCTYFVYSAMKSVKICDFMAILGWNEISNPESSRAHPKCLPDVL
jgi:hypothetical protein